MKFNIPSRDNARLARVVELIEVDEELEQLLKCANITAVDRMGYSDHGPTHSKIVANIALRIMRILLSRGVTPSIVEHYAGEEMDSHDAEVVVVLAAFLHDIGMVIHRYQHDLYGIVVARPVLERLLEDYPPRKRAIMVSEILHAMTFHDSPVPPLTVEGGIVRIADGLDMEEGRARIPFEAGKKDIHAVSALAIEEVDIFEGGKDEEPVQIRITMSNSAGIFQVDELLKRKIEVSKLAEYVHVTARMSGAEKGILKKIDF
jgi:metal-dependent HD superfamily phosphatase/phosphodiesterase